MIACIYYFPLIRFHLISFSLCNCCFCCLMLTAKVFLLIDVCFKACQLHRCYEFRFFLFSCYTYFIKLERNCKLWNNIIRNQNQSQGFPPGPHHCEISSVVLRKVVEPVIQHLVARMQEYKYCEEKIIPEAHFCNFCSITVIFNYLYHYTVMFI